VAPTDEVSDLTVRAATADDAHAVADLYTEARIHAVPQMPPALHTNAEDRAHVARRLADDDVQVWVAEQGGRLAAFATCTSTWLDSLYVRPDITGEGIGTVLLDLVKATHPAGFELWVFQSNTGARRFYERHGLVEVERTDGSGNEERSPDIRMAWRP
jgi:GNAT superfamily N-acetyltransferase